MAEKTKELEPIEFSHCQSEYLGGSFMTFGPRQYQRCPCIPTWIAVDVRDGQFSGAMSLCEDCKKVCEIKVPSASYQRIKL